MKLYPLKFQPLFHYRIWGGEKLKTVLNKEYSEVSIGESWEISTVPNNETVVVDGSLKGKTINELVGKYQDEFLGKNVYERFGEAFPLLIKFIDAKTPLSIQVHPDDELAKQRHNSFGKNEMWYVMGANKEAELIIGFNKQIDKESYKIAIEEGKIEEVLNSIKVLEGDTFFIPAGRVHAIGGGVMIAEIQQTSDVTYRIYDFNRVDTKTGAKRELHTDLSVDAIDFTLLEEYRTNYSTLQSKNELVHTPYFKTNILMVTGQTMVNVSKKESFKILMCVEGSVMLDYDNESYSLRKGETILLPASLEGAITLSGFNSKILEVYI